MIPSRATSWPMPPVSVCAFSTERSKRAQVTSRSIRDRQRMPFGLFVVERAAQSSIGAARDQQRTRAAFVGTHALGKFRAAQRANSHLAVSQIGERHRILIAAQKALCAIDRIERPKILWSARPPRDRSIDTRRRRWPQESPPGRSG